MDKAFRRCNVVLAEILHAFQLNGLDLSEKHPGPFLISSCSNPYCSRAVTVVSNILLRLRLFSTSNDMEVPIVTHEVGFVKVSREMILLLLKLR